MTSEKQQEANKRNALMSTGPKKEEGKAISSKNALKHGLLSQQVLFEDDDKEIFDSLCNQINKELVPVGVIETLLVDIITANMWKHLIVHLATYTELAFLPITLVPPL